MLNGTIVRVVKPSHKYSDFYGMVGVIEEVDKEPEMYWVKFNAPRPMDHDWFFGHELEEVTPTFEMPEVVTTILEIFQEQLDKDLLDFLKSHGFRPKPTKEYIVALQKRLAKKGQAVCMLPIKFDPGLDEKLIVSYKFMIGKLNEDGTVCLPDNN